MCKSHSYILNPGFCKCLVLDGWVCDPAGWGLPCVGACVWVVCFVISGVMKPGGCFQSPLDCSTYQATEGKTYLHAGPASNDGPTETATESPFYQYLPTYLTFYLCMYAGMMRVRMRTYASKTFNIFNINSSYWIVNVSQTQKRFVFAHLFRAFPSWPSCPQFGANCLPQCVLQNHHRLPRNCVSQGEEDWKDPLAKPWLPA